MPEKHMVCAGAICICQFGKAPAKLKVTTQQKHYINDTDGKGKLLATHNEIGQPFDPPFFASCTKMNNAPCAVAVTAWSGYYDKIKTETGGHPILEDSKATCAAGGKDCISISWHGQSAEPAPMHLSGTSAAMTAQINPLVNPYAATHNNPGNSSANQ